MEIRTKQKRGGSWTGWVATLEIKLNIRGSLGGPSKQAMLLCLAFRHIGAATCVGVTLWGVFMNLP